MSFTGWRTTVATINAVAVAIYIALIWRIAGDVLTTVLATALYLAAMPLAQWAVRRECEAAELQRLAILRKSQGDSADWKKVAEQLEQHIRTTSQPTVPEFPEEQK